MRRPRSIWHRLTIKVVQKYATALKDGADTSLTKEQRAKAYFNAAWLARYDGMELMGTEVSPDGFDFGGDFPDTDFAKERLAGQHSEITDAGNPTTAKNVAAASKAEIQRLKKNTIDPDRRYHYRYWLIPDERLASRLRGTTLGHFRRPCSLALTRGDQGGERVADDAANTRPALGRLAPQAAESAPGEICRHGSGVDLQSSNYLPNLATQLRQPEARVAPEATTPLHCEVR